MPQLLLTLVLIGIGWFLLIRPQQQRVRQQRALVATVEPGDRVITAGGIHGTLLAVKEETVEIEVAPDTVLTLARAAVAHRVDDGEDAGTGEHAAPASEGRRTSGDAGDPPPPGGTP
ncbi:hypothetical protein BH23ACT2_BH23ACT2_04060 [soil metagenome]